LPDLYVYWQVAALFNADLAVNLGAHKRLASIRALASSNLNSSVVSYIFLVNISKGQSCLN